MSDTRAAAETEIRSQLETLDGAVARDQRLKPIQNLFRRHSDMVLGATPDAGTIDSLRENWRDIMTEVNRYLGTTRAGGGAAGGAL